MMAAWSWAEWPGSRMTSGAVRPLSCSTQRDTEAESTDQKDNILHAAWDGSCRTRVFCVSFYL